MSITHEEAARAIAAAHSHAISIGIKVAVAVVDGGGALKSLARMDGAFPLSAQIAESKAVGAVMLHRNGDSLASLNQDRPAFFQALDRMARLPIIPGLGSLLVRRDDDVVGAIGVSGARPEQDLECAEAGLRALSAGKA